MAQKIEAKPLPLEELQASGAFDHSLWKGMGDNGTDNSLVGTYQAGVNQLQTLADIRAQQGSAKDKLATSDDPEAITYREWKAKGDSRAEAIDAEFKDAEKELHDKLLAIRAEKAKRKKLITDKLAEQQQRAIESITAGTKANLDVDGAVARYKEITDTFNAIVKLFVEFPAGDTFTALKGFRLPGPGVATGATRVGAGNGNATGTKRFRWGTVTVDGNTLTQPNTKDIAKAAGSNDHNHLLTALLTSLNGDYDNLPREPAAPHTFEFNGHTVSLALRQAEPKATGEATSEADTSTVDVEPVAA